MSIVSVLAGKKTYIAAGLMVTHAISEYWWGLGINIPEGLSAIGLAALRHGLSGTKATPDKPEVQVIELTPVSSFQYIPQTSSLLQSLEARVP